MGLRDQVKSKRSAPDQVITPVRLSEGQLDRSLSIYRRQVPVLWRLRVDGFVAEDVLHWSPNLGTHATELMPKPPVQRRRWIRGRELVIGL